MCRLMENAKILGQRRGDAEQNLLQANRHYQDATMEYRTIDKDMNTARPQLVKLQRQKQEYIRYTD